MKKISFLSFLFLVSLSLNSCKKSNSSSNSLGGTCSWTMTFDSQSYSWTGNLPAIGTNDGQSIFNANTGADPNAALVMASPTIGGIRSQNMVVSFLNSRTGSFQMNESSYDTNTLVGNTFNVVFNQSEIYSSQYPGSNITFNITELSQNSVASSGYTGAGYVKGNFNGIICDINGNQHTISGTFSSIRLL